MFKELSQFIINHLILNITWIILLLLLADNILKYFLYQARDIFPNEAIQLINKKNAIVVDTRSENLFFIGHIVGSFNISTVDICKKNIMHLKKYINNPIILVFHDFTLCRNCISSISILGFKKIYILKDGMYHWNRENLPLISK